MGRTYDISSKLAADLAERYLVSDMGDMMITGAREKAKTIRALSESNKDQLNKHVQEFRRNERVIYASLYKLVDGYGGYKIVEMEE